MSPAKSSKKEIKICHLADVHLGFRRYHRLTKNGFNQREMDVNAAFREAIDRLVEIQPDLVVLAGDLFHSVRPSNAVVTFCFRQLKRLVRHSKAHIVLVAGNHESPKRIDSGSILRLFREIERVNVADSQKEVFFFKDIDCSVTALPHAALQKGDHGKLSAPSECSHAILVTHAQVDESLRTEFGGSLLQIEDLSPTQWDYIALGHVHRFAQINYNSFYSGSLEHTSGNFWEDAGSEKGFIEVQLPELNVKFHSLSTQRVIHTLQHIDASKMDPEDTLALIKERLDAVPGGIDGKLVRLKVNNISREVARHLDYREIRRYKARALHLQLDLRILRHNDAIAEVTEKNFSLGDEIKEYCASEEENLREPELVQKCLLDYLAKVEAVDETSIT